MTDIVYLLGAGASADALPPVKDFTAGITKQQDWLLKSFPLTPTDRFKHNGKDYTYQEAVKDYIKASSQLKARCGSEMTFDEYAKRHWLKHQNPNDASYKQLKMELTTFFAIEQARNMKARARYDHLLTDLIVKGACPDKCIHDSVKILTWNYDQLLLLTLAEMSEWDDMHRVMDHFKVATLTHGDIPGFSIMHLNGLIGVANGSRTTPLIHGKDPDMREAILKALELHFIARKSSNGPQAPQTAISFGWENIQTRKARLDQIRMEIKDAKALVIIGYSFPSTNEEIDRSLFSDMDQLERVYIQMRNRSAEIWDTLKYINPRLRDDMRAVKDAKEEPYNKRFFYSGSHYR